MVRAYEDVDNRIRLKAVRIELLLTDCDGVLTDGSVFYSGLGEELKRFSLRDGMGFERLRKIAGVDVGIISGEDSAPLVHRADKLKVKELHLAVREKERVLKTILKRKNLRADQVAFIGDDYNDLEVMKLAGLSACPSDALPEVSAIADYVCSCPGGHGAFREFAELIIACRNDAGEYKS